MARYLGIYTNDIGIEYLSTLNVYLYSNGDKSLTTYDEDERILPSYFKNHTRRLIDTTDRGCSIDYRNIRKAIVYINNNQYYEIPCPFIGGSILFNNFFDELARNNKLVNLVGENLPYSYYLVIKRNV